MSKLGQSERATQNRVIALFRDELDYHYLDDWIDRYGNSNVKGGRPSGSLKISRYTPAQNSEALHPLRTKAYYN